MTIFNDKQRERVSFILDSEYSKLSFLSTSELEMLGFVSTFYSAKIEGNRYSLLEAKELLKHNIIAEKPYLDAIMLRNIYNCFNLLYHQTQKGEILQIDKPLIFNIHFKLSDELIDPRERGVCRQKKVMIGGSVYKPMEKKEELEKELEEILSNQNYFESPIERAIYLHCNIARLQPFIDCNKRTSRMLENLVLLQNDLIPSFSEEVSDIIRYKTALLSFYETQSYSLYVDYFLDKQIEKTNLFSPSKRREKTDKTQ